MDKKQKEKIKNERISVCENEIAKIEQAIIILKNKYQESLKEFEQKLEIEKFEKDIFSKIDTNG